MAKILVVDDSQDNLKAAQQTLAGHSLTLIDSYDVAVRILGDGWDVLISDLLMPASGSNLSLEARSAHAGKEAPVGFAIVLLAALAGVKRIAMVSATGHHDHPAAASLDLLHGAAFWSTEGKKDGYLRDPNTPRFTINGARVGFYHTPYNLMKETQCSKCRGEKKEEDGRDCSRCDGTGLAWTKDYGAVLNTLLAAHDDDPIVVVKPQIDEGSGRVAFPEKWSKSLK